MNSQHGVRHVGPAGLSRTPNLQLDFKLSLALQQFNGRCSVRSLSRNLILAKPDFYQRKLGESHDLPEVHSRRCHRQRRGFILSPLKILAGKILAGSDNV